MPKKSDRERSIWFSYLECIGYHAMYGFGNTFIIPFALFLQASTAMIGAIASLPLIVGPLFELLDEEILKRFKSRKKIIFWLTVFQSIFWLPLLAVPYLSASVGVIAVLILYTLISTMTALIVPAWYSYVGDIVMEHERGTYFSTRHKIRSAAGFLAVLVAGALLDFFSYDPVIGFSILLFIAFLSSMISAFFYLPMIDPPYNLPSKKHYFSFFAFIRGLKRRDNHFGTFVLFISVIGFSLFLISPFFVMYLLNDLQFSYFQYTLTTLCFVLAGFFALPFWGRVVDKVGTRFVMLVTTPGLPLATLLLVLSTDFFFICMVQILSGISWAGFNLATSTFLYDATTPQKRVRCTMYYSIIYGVAAFCGAMMGSFLVEILPSFTFVSSIPVLFIIASVVRIIAIILFLPRLKEMRFIDISLGKGKLFGPHLLIKPSSRFHMKK